MPSDTYAVFGDVWLPRGGVGGWGPHSVFGLLVASKPLLRRPSTIPSLPSLGRPCPCAPGLLVLKLSFSH